MCHTPRMASLGLVIVGAAVFAISLVGVLIMVAYERVRDRLRR